MVSGFLSTTELALPPSCPVSLLQLHRSPVVSAISTCWKMSLGLFFDTLDQASLMICVNFNIHITVLINYCHFLNSYSFLNSVQLIFTINCLVLNCHLHFHCCLRNPDFCVLKYQYIISVLQLTLVPSPIFWTPLLIKN